MEYIKNIQIKTLEIKMCKMRTLWVGWQTGHCRINFSEFEDRVIETTHKEIQKETHRE